MPSPISQIVGVAGESAYLMLPGDLPDYDPTSPDDYDPGDAEPPGLKVRGMPDSRLEKSVREGQGSAASAAFTFKTKCVVDGLEPDTCFLYWRGILYTILAVRRRDYLGKIDGYTLTLSA
jgi:hypothetical protein